MPGTGGHMDTTMQASLEADGPLHGFAVEILYPTFSLRLLDGSGFATINSNNFTGSDPTYGVTLVLPESFEDGINAEAPNVAFALQCPTNAAAAALCDPSAQGSQVTFWYWSMNRTTGLIIGTPYELWVGALDVPVLNLDRGQRLVRIEAESWFGLFLDAPDGNILSNADHQAIWPGELGLEYVTNVQQIMPWGADSPRPAVIRDVLTGQAVSSGVGAGQISPLPGSPSNPFAGPMGINPNQFFP